MYVLGEGGFRQGEGRSLGGADGDVELGGWFEGFSISGVGGRCSGEGMLGDFGEEFGQLVRLEGWGLKLQKKFLF